MGVKNCAHGLCKSDSRSAAKPHMAGITFFRFPNKKWHRQKCIRWVNACKRVKFTLDNVTRFTYICSRHFYGSIGPTPEHPDPISATASAEQLERFLKGRRILSRPPLPETNVTSSQQNEGEAGSSDCNIATLPPPSKGPRTYMMHAPYKPPCETSDLCETVDEEPVITSAATSCEVSQDDVFTMFGSPQKYSPCDQTANGTTTKADLFLYAMMPEQIIVSAMMNAMNKGWVIGRDNCHVSFHVLDGTAIAKSVILDVQTGVYKIEIEGTQFRETLPEHFPDYVSSEKSVSELLTKIQDANLCHGFYDESEPKLKAIAKEPRSAKCSRLLVKTGKRCVHCVSGRKALMNRVSRDEKKGVRNHQLAKLSQESLVQLVRTLRNNAILLQRKLARARANVNNTFNNYMDCVEVI